MPPRLSHDQASAVLDRAHIDPLEPYPGSGRPWLARCRVCGHEWRTRYMSIAGGIGCPGCSGMAPMAESEALAVVDSVDMEPTQPYPGKGSAVWMLRCRRCGKVSAKRAGVLKARGRSCCTGCPKPSRTKPHREAAAVALAADMLPLEKYAGKGHRWLVRCQKIGCWYEWRTNLTEIRSGRGCSRCAGRRLRISHSEALTDLHDASMAPLKTYPGYQCPWLVECLNPGCGHQWTTTLKRVRRGAGCPRCAGIVPPSEAEALSDLADAHIEPVGPYPGTASAKWSVRCGRSDCDHQWAVTLSAIRRGLGCRRCAGYLPVTESEALAELEVIGCRATEPYPGSIEKKWKGVQCLTCLCTFSPKLSNIRHNGSGCPKCRGGQIDLEGPAFVYLVANPHLASAKIGIANARSPRLRIHARHGWKLVKSWPVSSGRHAVEVERTVLRNWRQAGLPESVVAHDMPQGGHTETAPLASLDLEATIAEVDNLAAEQGSDQGGEQCQESRQLAFF